jgi:hypothetical protein
MGWCGQANSRRINQVGNYHMAFIIIIKLNLNFKKFTVKLIFSIYILHRKYYLYTYGQYSMLIKKVNIHY